MTDKPRFRRGDALPRSLPPIGLSREVAAAFIDVSPSKFDEMVRDGRMPKPKRIDSRRVWSRVAVERAFEALPGGEEDAGDMWEAFGGAPVVVPSVPIEQIRVVRAAEHEEWRRKLLASPLGKLEIRALAAAYEKPGQPPVHGVSSGTMIKLVNRGYIVDDDNEYIETVTLSAAGVAAYEAVQ